MDKLGWTLDSVDQRGNWRNFLATTYGSLTLIGDALGALQDALRFKAREPILNAIRAELALQLRHGSERNQICEALSRIQRARLVRAKPNVRRLEQASKRRAAKPRAPQGLTTSPKSGHTARTARGLIKDQSTSPVAFVPEPAVVTPRKLLETS